MAKDVIPQNGSYEDQYEIILEEFNGAMTAFQLQDLHSSENAFRKATMVYRNIDFTDYPEEKDLLTLMVNFIEVTSKYLRANWYLNDEKYSRSLEELAGSKLICENADEIFKRIPEDYDEAAGFNVVGTLEFLFEYYKILISVVEKIVRGSIEMREGKYVDEIEQLRSCARDLRMFDYARHDLGSDEMNKLVSACVALLNRIAETYDNKADRLQERRRVIEFMNPIDKRVFIVHGHNEAILLELKEMLEKSFKIDPIILRDEVDYGKTVIEKLESYGRLCAFAFVIITPDDIVENKKTKQYQARPNVLYELGWFCGRYGRSKVRILRQKKTPLPSDLDGIVTIDFNDKIEEVYRRIQLDLQTVNII